MTLSSHENLRPPSLPTISPWPALCLLLAALFIFRAFALYFSSIDLFFDEAQYWAWSEELAFGYFSKPPVLSWSIRAATELCGTSEFCIRLPSPIYHSLTALFIFLTGRALYNATLGLWSAIAYATLPGVSYSAGLISTDVPLLTFWSASLFFFVKLLQEKSWPYALLLGIGLGLGLMSKYAMAYFLLGATLFCFIAQQHRWLLTSPKLFAALAIAGLIIAPNIAWNIENGFVTFSHTAANAKWEGPLFHPGKAIEFFAAQFGVFGPIFFSALLIIAWRYFRKGLTETDTLLLCFALPIIVIVTFQAFISRAHANWAATAYPAAAILVTATMIRDVAEKWFKVSLWIHLAVIGVLALALASPGRFELPKGIDPFKRVLGWEEVANATRTVLSEGDYEAVITDSRALISELLYYLRDSAVPIKAWQPGKIPHNHFQLIRPFKPQQTAKPVLFVTTRRKPDKILRHFSSAKKLSETKIPTGDQSSRTLHFYSLHNVQKP